MRKFLFYLADNGHDVYSLMHEPKGDPTKKRPEAIEVLLQTIFKVLPDGERVHLVGHSYGAIDLARVLSQALDEDSSILERTASLTLVNPAGLKKPISLPTHISRFLRYVLPSILSKNLIAAQDEIDFLRSWFRLSLKTPFIRTIREVSDITRVDIADLLQEIREIEIPLQIIQNVPDTLLYPNGIGKMYIDPDHPIYGRGNHNGPLIDPAQFGGKDVLDAIHSINEAAASA